VRNAPRDRRPTASRSPGSPRTTVVATREPLKLARFVGLRRESVSENSPIGDVRPSHEFFAQNSGGRVAGALVDARQQAIWIHPTPRLSEFDGYAALRVTFEPTGLR
jgi:hypothetical protein